MPSMFFAKCKLLSGSVLHGTRGMPLGPRGTSLSLRDARQEQVAKCYPTILSVASATSLENAAHTTASFGSQERRLS